MIPEELRVFIEQNCSGKDPSEPVMEAISNKIELLGADANEVLAFVERCINGPSLEEKEALLSPQEKKTIIEQANYWLFFFKRFIKDDRYESNRDILMGFVMKIRSLYTFDSQLQNLANMLDEEIKKGDAIRKEYIETHLTQPSSDNLSMTSVSRQEPSKKESKSQKVFNMISKLLT